MTKYGWINKLQMDGWMDTDGWDSSTYALWFNTGNLEISRDLPVYVMNVMDSLMDGWIDEWMKFCMHLMLFVAMNG